MKVSVVIATYNRAAMVRETIEAALAQTLPPDEVLVSNDCSTDNTRETLDELARMDPRLKVFHQPVNSGGVPNWNFVAERAQGEYIAWCSDDDRFLPDHLEQSIAFLEAHPEVGVVHSSFIDSFETPEGQLREPRKLRSSQPILTHRGNLAPYFIRYYNWPFHPSTLVIRRSVWEAVGPFDKQYGVADTDWFARAALEHTLAYLPRSGVINRRHPGNWSNLLGSLKMQDEEHRIVLNAIKVLGKSAPLRGSWFGFIWTWNYRARLLLYALQRARAGKRDLALQAWHVIVHTFWLGRLRPIAAVSGAFGKALLDSVPACDPTTATKLLNPRDITSPP
jgi:glycosyltransferase involved in cell wall biosynthesis